MVPSPLVAPNPKPVVPVLVPVPPKLNPLGAADVVVVPNPIDPAVVVLVAPDPKENVGADVLAVPNEKPAWKVKT